MDDLSFFLSSLNVKFSVIGITETWLRDLSPVVNLNGYHFAYKKRSERSGGGVGMYIANNLDLKMRTDICFDDEEVMESLFVITRPQEKNVVVGTIYRPQNQNVNEVLLKVSRDNKICYLMGHFNLNLLNNQSHTATDEFLDGMYSC